MRKSMGPRYAVCGTEMIKYRHFAACGAADFNENASMLYMGRALCAGHCCKRKQTAVIVWRREG